MPVKLLLAVHCDGDREEGRVAEEDEEGRVDEEEGRVEERRRSDEFGPFSCVSLMHVTGHVRPLTSNYALRWDV